MGNHTGSGEVQWTVPEFWQPLLLIIGGGGLFSWSTSDDLLDRETYSDITSSDYRQPGISYLEGRAGAFVHAEVTPVDWVTVTGSLRFDYNTATDPEFSPRLATVVQPVAGQFFRAGVTRAFRKPSRMETQMHLMVDFPADSPITGPDRENFQEFMSRAIGNPEVDNEIILSLEAGYLGQFLDRRLQVALDLYFNRLTDLIQIVYETVPTPQGLPDLDRTTLQHLNAGQDLDIIGAELSARFDLTESTTLLAAWAHREVFLRSTGKCQNSVPKNLITLGGRFRLDSGLVGNLFLHSRSKFRDPKDHSRPRRFSRTRTSIRAVLFSGLHERAPRYSFKARS